jgi:hypothetical protein
MQLKCRGMNTALEMSSATSRQVSPHGASWSFYESSDRAGGGGAGVMQSGDNGVEALVMGAVTVLLDGVGLATELEDPSLCVKGWLL